MNLFKISVNSQEELNEILSKVSKTHFESINVEEGLLDEEGNFYSMNSSFTKRDLLEGNFPQASDNACYLQVGNILWQIAG